jgi:hypothetical protein
MIGSADPTCLSLNFSIRNYALDNKCIIPFRFFHDFMIEIEAVAVVYL